MAFTNTNDTHTISSIIVLTIMTTQKLPKDLLSTLVRETPFTASEIAHLWKRFQAFDIDGGGTISALVRKPFMINYRPSPSQ